MPTNTPTIPCTPSAANPRSAAAKGPYQYLADGATHDAGDGLTLKIDAAENWPTTLSIAGGEPTTVLTATGIGASTADRVPMMLLQRRAAATAFAWCLALDGQPASIRWLSVKDTTGAATPRDEVAAIHITTQGATVCLVSNPSKRPVRVSLPDGSDWSTEAPFAVRNLAQ